MTPIDPQPGKRTEIDDIEGNSYRVGESPEGETDDTAANTLRAPGVSSEGENDDTEGHGLGHI